MLSMLIVSSIGKVLGATEVSGRSGSSSNSSFPDGRTIHVARVCFRFPWKTFAIGKEESSRAMWCPEWHENVQSVGGHLVNTRREPREPLCVFYFFSLVQAITLTEREKPVQSFEQKLKKNTSQMSVLLNHRFVAVLSSLSSRRAAGFSNFARWSSNSPNFYDLSKMSQSVQKSLCHQRLIVYWRLFKEASDVWRFDLNDSNHWTWILDWNDSFLGVYLTIMREDKVPDSWKLGKSHWKFCVKSRLNLDRGWKIMRLSHAFCSLNW